MRLTEHVSLAPHTTFGIGGPARFFVEAENEEDIREAIAFARERNLPLHVLGGGSNVLVADSGFPGVVLVPGLQNLSYDDDIVTAGAGVEWDVMVEDTIAQGLAGLESLSGIPGTVGGAVVQSIGAYGAQVSDTIVFVAVLDRDDDEARAVRLTREECGFSYHDSIFGREPNRYVIISATFKLSRGPARFPAYKDNRFDAAAFVAERHHEPTLLDVREAILSIRREKGVVIESDGTSFKSAGSFFHMPFVSKTQYERMLDAAQERDAAMEERLRPWAWKQPDGTWKIAPGFLLEYTEFKKGYRRGAVGISPKHTLTVVNHGDATATEVAALAREMQGAVERVFGIVLEREVEYVGEVE